jgi:choline dehydrogenase
VEYSADGQVRQACPRGETILSSGPIGSAQLLMSSGIGPAEHLRAVGVDVVADLPGVRANLQDHPLAGIIYAAAQPVPPAQNKLGEVRAAVRTTPGLAGPDVQVFLIDMPFHPPSMPGPAAGTRSPSQRCIRTAAARSSWADADPSSAPVIETPTQSGHVRAHIPTRIARVLSVMRGA